MPNSPTRSTSSSNGKEFIETLVKNFGIDEEDYQFVFKQEANENQKDFLGISCKIDGVAIFLMVSNKTGDDKDSSNPKLDIRNCHGKNTEGCENINSFLKDIDFPKYESVDESRKVLFYERSKIKNELGQLGSLFELLKTDGESLSGVMKLLEYGDKQICSFIIFFIMDHKYNLRY